MDDTYFFGALIYLVLVVIVSSVLPSSFYDSGTEGLPSDSLLRDSVSQSPDGITEQLNFFQKIVTFMFLTISIDGVGVIIGGLILGLNLIMIVIPVVWVYDKVRGI